MQPNPATVLLQTMGALLIPLMGSALPVRAAVKPCWDAALLDDTWTKAASRATVQPACGALLCVQSAFAGRKEMSSVFNNELPGSRDPRQGARCGHPSQSREPGAWAQQTVRPRPPPLSPAPLGATCCFSLLHSALAALTAVTREGYSLCGSLSDLRSPHPNTYAPQPTDKAEKTNWQCHSFTTWISCHSNAWRWLFSDQNRSEWNTVTPVLCWLLFFSFLPRKVSLRK